MDQHIKTSIDAAAFVGSFGALVGLITPLAALLSAIWTLIRIWEWWRGKRSAEP